MGMRRPMTDSLQFLKCLFPASLKTWNLSRHNKQSELCLASGLHIHQHEGLWDLKTFILMRLMPTKFGLCCVLCSHNRKCNVTNSKFCPVLLCVIAGPQRGNYITMLWEMHIQGNARDFPLSQWRYSSQSNWSLNTCVWKTGQKEQ